MKVKNDHHSKPIGKKKPVKIRASTRFKPVTSAIRVRALPIRIYCKLNVTSFQSA